MDDVRAVEIRRAPPVAPGPGRVRRFAAGLGRELPGLVVFALLAAAPFVGTPGHLLTLLARGMTLALGAVSLALLVGGAGLPSLGHAAMLGIGAYAVVVLEGAGVTEALTVVPVAMAAAAAFALVTGAIALRTAGVNFIMITLAFGQMAFFGAGSLSAYGGDDGATLTGRTEVLGTRLLEDRVGFHLVCLGALVLGWVVVRVVLASRGGRVLRAARGSALRVQAAGLSPYPYRLGAYVLAGALGGLAGVLLANGAEFVSPSYLAWQRSGDLLFMVILGGAGPTGAVVGALAYVGLEEWLSGITEHWRLIFGPLLVLAALFARGGLVGLLPRWTRR